MNRYKFVLNFTSTKLIHTKFMHNFFICTKYIHIKFLWINIYMYKVYLYVVFFYRAQQAAYYWAEVLQSGLTGLFLNQISGLPFAGFNPHAINCLVDQHMHCDFAIYLSTNFPPKI